MKTGEGHLLKKDASNYDSGKYEKPSVTVDICICTQKHRDIYILLIKRKYPPFQDRWAIPGGFVSIEKKETLEQTAARELKEETGLENIYTEQLKTYGDPDRDPRMRIITVAYYALVSSKVILDQEKTTIAGDDAKEYKWFSLTRPPEELAFDHKRILSDLLSRLRGKVCYTPIAFNFLPKKFTWNQLQEVYESILCRKLFAPNFRRKIKSLYKIKILKSTRKAFGRPATLLSFKGIKEL